MITQHLKVYVNPNLKPAGFNSIIRNVLGKIKKELNKIVSAYYTYNVNTNEISADNIFRIIERTWVGVLNNALTMVDPEIATLQEFSVWSDERNIGRCDLSFRHYHEGEKDDFVTEAKVWECTNNWETPTPPEFYRGILGQAYNYYSTEKKYYDDYRSNVWLFAFVIEWIRNKTMLDAAKEIMSKWDPEKDPDTDFLTLYIGTERGAFVYGKIVSAKEFGLSRLSQ